MPRKKNDVPEKELPLFVISEILDLAVKLEKNGEATYRRAVDQVDNPELISLLNWMADEEVQHASWFAELKRLSASSETNPFMEEMSRELFDDLVGDQSFSLQEVDFSKIRSVDELLKVFIEFERDTAMFYELLIPFIEDEETSAHLQRIIAEENNHIKRISEFVPGELELASLS
jgi:rubrerythrin